MEMSFNQIVRRQIDAYATRRRDQVSHMLALANYYFPIFEEALERYGLPLELRYLPVIESALNPVAVSRVGAAGLWQFMPRTARGFGLEISTLVDERRCVHRSTEAAVRYLRNLYAMFGDWKLVLAAYNSGMGTVQRAIARSGGVADYWAIYHRLPRETRGFVPIFIAAVYIMNFHQEHGICAMRVDPLFLGVDTVHVNERIHFEQISSVLDIPVRDLQRLNPKFRRDIIPATHDRAFALALPTRSIYAFIERKDEIVGHNRNQHFAHRVTVDPHGAITTISGNVQVTNRYHRIRSGDTLGALARRNNTTVGQLQRWNNMNHTRLSVGRQLIVGQTVVQLPPPPPPEVVVAEVVRPSPPNVTINYSDIIADFLGEEIEGLKFPEMAGIGDGGCW
jgi:membrane-bound lytic murein transglycosylase D